MVGAIMLYIAKPLKMSIVQSRSLGILIFLSKKDCHPSSILVAFSIAPSQRSS